MHWGSQSKSTPPLPKKKHRTLCTYLGGWDLSESGSSWWYLDVSGIASPMLLFFFWVQERAGVGSFWGFHVCCKVFSSQLLNFQIGIADWWYYQSPGLPKIDAGVPFRGPIPFSLPDDYTKRSFIAQLAKLLNLEKKIEAYHKPSKSKLWRLLGYTTHTIHVFHGWYIYRHLPYSFHILPFKKTKCR